MALVSPHSTGRLSANLRKMNSSIRESSFPPREVLLGYPNEYGKYTARPLLPADAPFSSVLPFAEDEPDKRDLARNGTFVVIRQLQQDVRGFWRYLDKNSGSDPNARQQLAESIVGRRMDGTPLTFPIESGSIAGVDPGSAATNRFTFRNSR